MTGLLEFIDLGRQRYGDALEIQREAQARMISMRDQEPPMPVFMVEHDPPVITITRRPEASSHLLASPESLASLGVELQATDRGGDITYHGPGQLVVYPILDLNRLGLRIHSYMRFLEDVIIDSLAHFGVLGVRDNCATGVWVDTQNGLAKVCAMGVRVSRWVSMHGLALNVDPNLSHFNLIVPCGLAGRPVTSLQALMGLNAPGMEGVKRVLSDRMSLRAQALATGCQDACATPPEPVPRSHRNCSLPPQD